MVIDQLWGVCHRIESWIDTQRDHITTIPTPSVQHEVNDPERVFAIMQWPFVTPDAAVHSGDFTPYIVYDPIGNFTPCNIYDLICYYDEYTPWHHHKSLTHTFFLHILYTLLPAVSLTHTLLMYNQHLLLLCLPI